MQASSAKQLELESVRGLASLAVVFSHLALGLHPQFFEDGLSAPWVRIWFQGGFAVCVFFVLSGFVLSASFFRTGKIAAVQSATVRRYFRLAIPIAAAVLLSCGLFKAGLYSHHQAAYFLGQDDNSWLNGLLNFEPGWRDAAAEALWRAEFNYDVSRTYVPVLWTMQIELAGSLLVFGFLALAGTLRNRWLAYVAVGGVLAGLEQKFLIDFLVGIALCDAAQSGWLNSSRFVAVRGSIGILCVVAGLACGGIHPEWFRQTTGLPWIGITAGRHVGAILLIAGVLLSNPIKSLLNVRPLVWLGAISFPLYLFHMPLFCSLGTSLLLALEEQAGWSRPFAILAAEAATIAASLLVAELGRWTIEPLSIAIGRWIDEAIFRPKAAVTVTPSVVVEERSQRLMSRRAA